MNVFIQAGEQLQILRYTIAASVALVCYEYLIKLDSEVRYLWRRRLTFAGGLLFLCRYFPFLTVMRLYVYVTTTRVNNSNCMTGLRTSTCIVYIEFLLAVMVLFTRAYAVWGGTRRILSILALVYAGGIVGTAYSVFLYIKGVSFLALRIGRTGCLFNRANESLWIALVILIFCESLALALLLAKSVLHARTMKSVLTQASSRRNILLIMAQDGIGYFACTLAITTANLIVLKRVTPVLRDFLFVVQGALQGILCSRLLIHIHVVNEFPDGSILSAGVTQQANSSHTVVIEMNPVKHANNTSKWKSGSKKSLSAALYSESEIGFENVG
ncbi:hypothetical protein SCHPADRAFT_730522 [Schizopora paradoxa]|uniref:DUF6533 domain-containing protein n=1 Tax=Schizopora paradoxa TaxID=27342 RepID=A0A0H2R0U8_9AGAM|nr:hypothetical protein SCHPADRAFT_730522 [Schizopora paradoxa]